MIGRGQEKANCKANGAGRATLAQFLSSESRTEALRVFQRTFRLMFLGK